MNTEELTRRVRELDWYHTLELAPGVVTPGMFDLRPFVHEYRLPARLDGLRVLDVGTWDGFWAWEMERRGAEEVHGLDIDDVTTLDCPPRRRPTEFPEDVPRGEGFRLAKEVFGSKAERVNCNLYDAVPEDLGTYDLVFAGSVLIHMRDQLKALERMADLLKPGGVLISAEEYDVASSLLPVQVARYRADRDAAVVFWLPSIRTWRSMLWTAGFDEIAQRNRFTLKARAGWGVRHVVFHARKRG